MYDSDLQTATVTQGRWDIYGPVHKGIRLGHGALLTRLGRADWGGDERALLTDLRAHLRLGAQHLDHEEKHIHAALNARQAGAADDLDDQHDAHRAHFAVLLARIDGLEAAAPQDRPALGRALYLDYSEMVAADLAHMRHEEAVIWPQLCALFTDAELQAIEMTIIGSLSPDDNMAYMRLMIPAMNRDERAGLLGGMKAGAPPEVFAAVIDHAARPTLSVADLSDLDARGLI